MSTGKTLFPSFLPCNPFCFCSAATGSTSPLSQDGLCRFYFFSVIPQTHFLTRITKINDDFWFLNKKTKQIQLSGSNLTESSVFCHCVHLCVSNHSWLSTSQPASHQRFISCKLLCARSDSDIWREKNSPLNMFYKLCEGKFTFPPQSSYFLSVSPFFFSSF